MRLRMIVATCFVALLTFGPVAPAAACYGEPCDSISQTCKTVDRYVPKYDLLCDLG